MPGAKGVQLGFLKYVLGFDSLSFKKGITAADADLARLQRGFAAQGKKFSSLGKTISLGFTAPFAALAAKGIEEAQQTAAAMAQVTAALSSMGPVAGRTAGQLAAAANAFEGTSLFEADAILKEVTANLLTFGNISGKAFDQAQQAALDLSARLGTDLQSSAILVGKALNDPVKGMAALGRAGIQFSVDQKAAIQALVETGNVAGAQAIILGEFQKQFGGAAAAAQNADPFNKMRDAFNNMAETIGTALLPLIPPLTNAVVSVANAFTSLSPQTQKWLIIAAGTVAVLGPVLVALGSLVTVIGAIGPLVAGLATGFGVLKTAFVIARVAALATLPALLPFIVPLGAIALAVGAVYLAWKNWDKIKAIVVGLYNSVKTYMLDKLNAVWDGVKAKVAAVGDYFHNLWDRVVGHSYIPDMVDAIGQHMARLDAEMVKPVKAATDAAANSFRDLQGRVRSLLERLFPEQARTNAFNRDLADLTAYAEQAHLPVEQLAAAMARLKAEYATGLSPANDNTAANGVVSAASDAGDAVDGLAETAKKSTAQVIESFGQMATQTIGSVRDMVASFKSGDILGGIQTLLNTVVNVIGALGQIGVKFGSRSGAAYGGVSGDFANFGGARAGGGPVVPGKTYLVGERGPEFITANRSGFVHPNGSGGGIRVQVVKGDLFDVIIDQRASNVAAPMAGRAAVMGAQGGVQAISRRGARMLPR